ncbi:hypothetical protein D7W82_17805, partial [Corallococcus sp. CA049B]
GAGGSLVGVVHETQVLAGWRTDPLAQVSDVMARVRKTHAVRSQQRRLARLHGRRGGREKLF